MTTFAELARALLPRARWAGAPDPAAREAHVTWVRVMRPRVPAFDGLESGDVAIVSAAALAVVAPGQEELRAVAEACRAAGVAGLLLVGRDGRTGDAAATTEDRAGVGAATTNDRANVAADETHALDAIGGLVPHLAAAGLPALDLGSADVAALERAVIGYLVTGGAELERQAAALESRLERQALEGGGPTAMVAAIATFFGRAVALEGRRGDPLAVHAPEAVADSAVAAARYEARPRGPVALRVPLPGSGASAGGRGVTDASATLERATTRGPGPGIAGALVLLGERPPSDLELAAVGRIAGLLALEFSRDEAVRRARTAARRGEDLPAAGPPWVMLLARQRVAGDGDDDPEAIGHRESIRRELQLLAPARRLALRGDAESLEIRAVLAIDPGEGPDPAGLVFAGRIAAFLGRTVAISAPFGSVADRPAAEADARAALEAAEALPGAGPVAQATRLPVYRMLGALHHLGDGDRLARALLEPLLRGRPDVREEHLSTLRAVLDRGSAGEAATALGVHRNTIAYRLRRIETVGHWDLADPELRLALSLALRLVQNR